MSEFKQPSGDYCGQCQHLKKVNTLEAKTRVKFAPITVYSCKSFGNRLWVLGGKPLRLDECKAEDA